MRGIIFVLAAFGAVCASHPLPMAVGAELADLAPDVSANIESLKLTCGGGG